MQRARPISVTQKSWAPGPLSVCEGRVHEHGDTESGRNTRGERRTGAYVRKLCQSVHVGKGQRDGAEGAK